MPGSRLSMKGRGYHAVDAPGERAGAVTRGADAAFREDWDARQPLRVERSSRPLSRQRVGPCWSSRWYCVSGRLRRCGSTRRSPSTSPEAPLHLIPHLLRDDGAPPLYYVLLHFWMKVFGTSDLGARSLSGVIGVLTLPVAWVAGYRVGSQSWRVPGGTESGRSRALCRGGRRGGRRL